MPKQTHLHEVLRQAGAHVIDQDGYTIADHLGDPHREYQAAREAAGLFDTSHRSKLELAGPEARLFLQNISTQDINNLEIGHGHEVFLTTAKARIIAHGFVSRLPGDNEDILLVDAAPGHDEIIYKHMDHFLVSEQVFIENRTESLGMLTLVGPRARTVLEHAGDPLPDLANLQHTDVSVQAALPCRVRRNDHLALPGYDIFFPAEMAAPLWDALTAAGAIPAGHQAYEILRIEAGFPRYGPDMDENRLAMEVGRTAQAICYTKGCFLGQETIVMARDRGHVNRTLLGLRINTDKPILGGAKVMHDGKDVGQISSAVMSPTFGMIALAYLQRGYHTPGQEVTIEDKDQKRQAVIASLPFA